MKIAAGVEVGPYHVIEQVGRGGMATVFKAYQPALERYVAITKLRHPGILSVFAHGEFEGQPYIVTEFVEGGTFQQQLAGKPISVQQTLEVLQPIAAALDYAHERGVLHRDIKPSNILITKEGAPVLGDFGLAKMITSTERLTRIDSVVGTPEYMAPEQCAGKETGPAADRYSFGVVAYEALTGHVPYQAETPAAVMLAQIQSPLPDPRVVNPAINENVERALLRALSKDPDARFPSCSAFVRALAATDTPLAEPRVPAPVTAAAAPTVAAAPPVLPPPPAGATPPALAAAAPRRTLPLLIGAGALVAVLALAGVIDAIGANKGTTSPTHGSTSPSAAAGVPHGSVVYDAPLSAGAWGAGNTPSPDPSGALTLSYPGQSLDFKILKDDASVSAEFDAPALKNYVTNLVLDVDAGSDLEFDWDLRNQPSGPGNIFLSFDVKNEAMTLWLSPINGGDNRALTAAINVPGLQSGAKLDLWMVVNGDNIKLYLGSKKVADVTETTVTGAATPNLYMQGKAGGGVHLLTVRYYTVS